MPDRRIVMGAVAGLVSVGLAGWALRPHQLPTASLAPDAGAVVMGASHVPAWSGTALCRAGVDTSALVDETTGSTARVPLAVIRSLTFAGHDLVAAGRDRDCVPRIVRTANAGHTWSAVPAPPADAADAATDGSLWLLPATPGDTVERVGSGGALSTIRVGCPSGLTISAVSVFDPANPMALYQDDVGLRRTLARSGDAGAHWEWAANETSGAGLAGVGLIRNLVAVEGSTAWLLKDSRRCPEGELRTTTDAGSTWKDLPCPAVSTHVGHVLAIDFADRRRGVLLGTRGAHSAVAYTKDGGRSWQLGTSQ